MQIRYNGLRDIWNESKVSQRLFKTASVMSESRLELKQPVLELFFFRKVTFSYCCKSRK